MTGLLPPLLLALFGAWCGTFAGSASAPGSTVGALVLLGMATLAPWRDPLRLGRFSFLLPAIWIVAALSAWRSPVPRASWMALLLLPAFFLLPAAVARCWNRLSPRGIAVVVLVFSLWALIDHQVRDLPRVSMPLGQHNLLASWLVIVLPLALIPVREPGVWRWLGAAAGLLAVVTILATRSLAGNLALAAEGMIALAWIVRRRRSRVLGLVPLLVVATLYSQRVRIASIVAGQDLSMQGRAVYYEGGWEGFRERPLLGWGPGSAAWTATLFFDPVPGASPVGEAVGELHSLPLHLAYELGAAGLIACLALGAVFFWRRIPEADGQRLAGLAGLCGAAVASLGSAALAVTALPVAVAVAAGAALGETRQSSRMPVVAYALVAALGLAPLEAARWAWDRQDLDAAIRLDPGFPLYRMRQGLLQGQPELALSAARDAPGVATLWTVAGILGADRPWGAEALERACSLDPFNPFPPFYRMALTSNGEAARHGAHALLAEPRMAAATFWETHPDLLARSEEAMRRWPEIDPGWKEELARRLPAEPSGPVVELALEIDTEPPLALSLHTFRRRPMPAQWPLVRVRQLSLKGLELPPATTLPGPAFEGSCQARSRPRIGHGVRTP